MGYLWIRWAGATVAAVVLIGLAAPVSAAEPGTEFFEKKIRPVLAEHCYKCHSADATKLRGSLFLDTRAGLRKGGDTGQAVVPGKPGESLLLKAVRYDDEKLRMPPKGKLPDTVIADLEKWIAMGAPDPRGEAKPAAAVKSISIEEGRKFWAFQSPRRHPVPEVKDPAWPRTEIDRFILATLEAKGLKPAADADRATLIRRAYFDLIGLPPAPHEIDAFVNDKSPEAWEKVIDQLLASPHFGERWGRHWLDVARYADSSGGGRSLLFPDSWRYRDYVIESFNSDKPYSRFIIEQIAGDLLPHSNSEQRQQQLAATAFLALGPTNYERQDKSILEMDVIDEQLDTIGRAFLGMTVGCARCHDHKFDPIPTRDYYALAGIFRSTQTLVHDNVSRWVEQPLPLSPEQEAALKKHEAEVASLKEAVKLAKQSGKPDKTAVAKGIVKPSDLPGLVLDDSQAKKVGQWTHSKFTGSYISEGYLHDGDEGKGQKTLTFVPDFPQAGRYEVRLAYTTGGNRATKVPIHILHLDGEFDGHVNMQETPPIDGRFVSLGTFRFDKSGQWYVIISNEGTNGHVIVDAVQFLPENMVNSGRVASGGRESPGAASRADDVTKLEEKLKKLTESGPKRAVAMGVKEAAKIDDCHICIRGNFHNPGEKAPRGFLQVLSPETSSKAVLPANESGRRQLADWLASADNPLTARVMANRVWHWLFGAGLVRTVDEFGKTGEPPSHPELLDYLALKFAEEGWSVKKLIREIMLSRTYEMASLSNLSPMPPPRIGEGVGKGVTPPLRTGEGVGGGVDPENRLLWRQNRRRLDAEAIRDAILSVGGTLNKKPGGPSVKNGTAGEYGYAFDDSRRSVYTPIFRNRLHELFEAFDFPDPNLVSGRRNVSTVATQALYLMNNPFVMEQARHAAKVAIAAPNLDDAARIDRAYRMALGRLPTEKEREISLRFIEKAGEKQDQRLAAWERFYQALFASIDFRYVN